MTLKYCVKIKRGKSWIIWFRKCSTKKRERTILIFSLSSEGISHKWRHDFLIFSAPPLVMPVRDMYYFPKVLYPLMGVTSFIRPLIQTTIFVHYWRHAHYERGVKDLWRGHLKKVTSLEIETNIHESHFAISVTLFMEIFKNM